MGFILLQHPQSQNLLLRADRIIQGSQPPPTCPETVGIEGQKYGLELK